MIEKFENRFPNFQQYHAAFLLLIVSWTFLIAIVVFLSSLVIADIKVMSEINKSRYESAISYNRIATDFYAHLYAERSRFKREADKCSKASVATDY